MATEIAKPTSTCCGKASGGECVCGKLSSRSSKKSIHII